MATDMQVDVIVVGSGPSAVNAAYPLVEAGLAVRILRRWKPRRDVRIGNSRSAVLRSAPKRPAATPLFPWRGFRGYRVRPRGIGRTSYATTAIRLQGCSAPPAYQVFDLSPTAEPRRGRPWGCLGCGKPVIHDCRPRWFSDFVCRFGAALRGRGSTYRCLGRVRRFVAVSRQAVSDAATP